MATGLRRCRPQLHTVIWIVLVGLMLLSISPQANWPGELYLKAGVSANSSDGGAPLADAAAVMAEGLSTDAEARRAADLERLLSQVDRDLAPYRERGIDLRRIEQQYCEIPQNTMRFQVVGGKGYVVGEQRGYQSRQHHIKLVLNEVMQLHGPNLPDADFIIFTDDHPVGRQGNPQPCHPDWGPQLVLSKPSGPFPIHGVHGDMLVLIPCNTFGGFPEGGNPGWREITPELHAAAMNASWGSRKEQLAFRGGRTSEERKLLFDYLKIHTEPLFDIMESSGDGLNPGRKSLPQHCEYKYLLHLQGNSYSTRLKWLMACHSVVVFAVDRDGGDPDIHLRYHQEFWFHMLQDGENIVFAPPITVNDSGTHLADIVRKLKADDARAQRIAEGAGRLIDVVLSWDNVVKYWGRLITRYAAVQTFNVTLHADAVPVAESLASVHPREGPFRKRTCTVCGRWPPDNDL